MKVKISFTMIGLAACIYCCYSQEIRKKPKGITLVTVPMGEKSPNVPTPSKDCKIFKVRLPEFSNDMKITVYFEEYLNGQLVPSDFDVLHYEKIDKGRKCVFELAPDLKDSTRNLTLFSCFPSATFCRNKNASSGCRFKYLDYDTLSAKAIDKPVPVLFIYEDNNTNSVEMKLKKAIKQKPLPTNPDAAKKLYAGIKRYFLAYYKITPIQ